jgi:hypothetical protein
MNRPRNLPGDTGSMRQVKLFKGIDRDQQVQVVRISGNISPQSRGPTTKTDRFAPSDVMIIVEYETR